MIQSKLSEFEAMVDVNIQKLNNTPGKQKGLALDGVNYKHDIESGQPIEIEALAKFLGVGVNTAQKLKNEQIIPYFQNGRIVLFDRNQVNVALAEYNKLKRGKQ